MRPCRSRDARTPRPGLGPGRGRRRLVVRALSGDPRRTRYSNRSRRCAYGRSGWRRRRSGRSGWRRRRCLRRRSLRRNRGLRRTARAMRQVECAIPVAIDHRRSPRNRAIQVRGRHRDDRGLLEEGCIRRRRRDVGNVGLDDVDECLAEPCPLAPPVVPRQNDARAHRFGDGVSLTHRPPLHVSRRIAIVTGAGSGLATSLARMPKAPAPTSRDAQYTIR